MKKIIFENIETILLDMDGTILDKYFDDYFWEIYVPRKFSEVNGITFEEGQKKLFSLYKAEEGTLNWTDIDFWSKKTGLDILSLKMELQDLINPHPDSEDFLKTISSNGKRVYLVTNAHKKVVNLKLTKTGFHRYFHHCVSSFDLGVPKENITFWEKLKKKYNINPENTLFVDDTESVLDAAWISGIRYPILRGLSSSQGKLKKSDKFFTIQSFSEIINFLQ